MVQHKSIIFLVVFLASMLFEFVNASPDDYLPPPRLIGETYKDTKLEGPKKIPRGVDQTIYQTQTRTIFQTQTLSTYWISCVQGNLPSTHVIKGTTLPKKTVTEDGVVTIYGPRSVKGRTVVHPPCATKP